MLRSSVSKEKFRAITLSNNGEYILASRNIVGVDNKAVIELWEIENDICLMKYSGHSQEKYVLRPIFGGKFEKYIVSGSENDKVYIWDRTTGEIVDDLEGHQNVTNGIVWSSNCPNYLFSCSYDQTIKVWGNNKEGAVVEIDQKYLVSENDDPSNLEIYNSDQSMNEEDSEAESNSDDSNMS